MDGVGVLKPVWHDIWGSAQGKITTFTPQTRILGGAGVFAWILLSIGAAIIVSSALFVIGKGFFLDGNIPLIVRLGAGAGLLGFVILVISVVRHRIATYKTDKYKGVIR